MSDTRIPQLGDEIEPVGDVHQCWRKVLQISVDNESMLPFHRELVASGRWRVVDENERMATSE